jgi:hypothetical protein
MTPPSHLVLLDNDTSQPFALVGIMKKSQKLEAQNHAGEQGR